MYKRKTSGGPVDVIGRGFRHNERGHASPRDLLCGQVGKDMQSRLKLHLITSPDRPGLHHFSHVR